MEVLNHQGKKAIFTESIMILDFVCLSQNKHKWVSMTWFITDAEKVPQARNHNGKAGIARNRTMLRKVIIQRYQTTTVVLGGGLNIN